MIIQAASGPFCAAKIGAAAPLRLSPCHARRPASGSVKVPSPAKHLRWLDSWARSVWAPYRTKSTRQRPAPTPAGWTTRPPLATLCVVTPDMMPVAVRHRFRPMRQANPSHWPSHAAAALTSIKRENERALRRPTAPRPGVGSQNCDGPLEDRWPTANFSELREALLVQLFRVVTKAQPLSHTLVRCKAPPGQRYIDEARPVCGVAFIAKNHTCP
jgi:hypothetical protein